MTPWLSIIVEHAANTILVLDPQTRTRFQDMAGKRIAIEIKGTGKRVVLQCSVDGRWHAETTWPGPPNLTVRAPMAALLALAGPGNRMLDLASYRQIGIEFEGDMGIAELLHSTLRSFDFDWEEPIARITGDITARQIGNLARSLSAAVGAAGTAAAHNLSEQLHYGYKLMPSGKEVEAFLRAVDEIRFDTDRLAERVRRLTGFSGATR